MILILSKKRVMKMREWKTDKRRDVAITDIEALVPKELWCEKSSESWTMTDCMKGVHHTTARTMVDPEQTRWRS